MKKNFLTAEWKKLAIANYKTDPSVLSSFIPSGTSLDVWNNTCYVSLVGFMFLNTRVKGIKIPFHINFEEVNLRFYVKHFNGKEWKRGVTFIKEIVPRRMITFTANTIYGEKYETMKMDHEWKTGKNEIRVGYRWKKNQWHSFFVTAGPEAQEIKPGSEEEFITEHYWGYTQTSRNKTSEYEVEHPRWKVYPVRSFEIKADFEQVYGKSFSFLNNINPVSVMLAEGSEIKVNKGVKLTL
ncbi:MAG: YqjF family protein [Bacteroidota bacterium]